MKGDNGELFFEIQLVAFSGEDFLVEALFDTGFTDGWLCRKLLCGALLQYVFGQE